MLAGTTLSTREYKSNTYGLARMNAPNGTLVAFSAGPGQVAVDGTGSNSPYTAALVRVMDTPGLPIEALFKQVRIDVQKATNNKQTPWEESSLTGDFYFAPPEPPAPIR